MEWRLRTYVVMLVTTWSMFLISTVFWVTSFAFLVAKVRSPVVLKAGGVANVEVIVNAIGRINVRLTLGSTYNSKPLTTGSMV